MNYKIYEEADRLRSEYDKPVELMDGLERSQLKVIRMAEFYSNSRFLNGQKDELDRDKPFANIGNFRVTIAKTGTDLDTKHFRAESDTSDHVRSMLLSKELHQWMKEVQFARTLNRFGLYRPKYGGAMIKTTEGDEGPKIDVVEWKNVATDQVDIKGGNKIEYHYMTPVELAAMEGAWNNVREVLRLSKGQSNRKAAVGGQQVFSSSRITVIEVNGVFPDAVLKDAKGKACDEDDEFIYSRQRYFIYGDDKKQVILYAERAKDDPYDYLAWEEVPGCALGRGVWEDTEEAQVWTNDAFLNEKRAMDLASKVVLKTNDPELANNVLEVDNGKIFQLGAGKDLNALQLTPTSIGKFQELVARWDRIANNATSTYDASTGEQPPANTPYSTTALLNSVASKPLEYRREEAGIFWADVIMRRVMPHLAKRIDGEHILASEFTAKELEMIDDAFATFEANKAVMTARKAGKRIYAEEYAGLVDAYKKAVSKGVRRFIEVPKGYFKGFKAKITVDPTGETRDKQAMLQSLSQVVRDVQGSFNPSTGEFMILKDPVMSAIFSKMLEIMGVSPASLGIGSGESRASRQVPAMQPAPVAA